MVGSVRCVLESGLRVSIDGRAVDDGVAHDIGVLHLRQELPRPFRAAGHRVSIDGRAVGDGVALDTGVIQLRHELQRPLRAAGHLSIIEVSARAGLGALETAPQTPRGDRREVDKRSRAHLSLTTAPRGAHYGGR